MIKKQITILISILFCISISSQEKSTKQKLIDELSENTCKCVDSISLFDKKKDSIIKNIHECIDKNALALQLGILLSEVEESSKKNKNSDTKKNITLNLETNKDSEKYRENYNSIERSLMKNCSSLKKAMNVAESKSEKLSKNDKALEFYNMAISASKKEDWKETIKNYENAVKIDPEFTYAWDNLGITYRKVGDYDKALEAYKKSLEVDPKGKMALQNIPIAYAYKKEYQKAIDAYKDLDKMYPGDPEVYYGMGNIYFSALKENEKALDYMAKALRIYDNQKSPYRTDAETLISYIYKQMQEEGKVEKFKEILNKNKIEFK